MPTATEIAQESLALIPSGSVVSTSHSSSRHNLLFDPLASDEIRPFATEEIVAFRQWLATVPFEFQSLIQSVTGRHCDSEGDVRAYFEPAIILACWPILLSMLPPSADDRTFDLALRMERSETYDYTSRPDVSVLRLIPAQGDDLVLALKALSIVEFKGPGVMNGFFVGESINPNIVSSDDWDRVTRQIRKYAAELQIRDVLVIDDRLTFYVRFDGDARDSGCTFAVAGVNYALTSREAFLFSVYNALKSQGVPIRNYVNELESRFPDYVEKFPGRTAGGLVTSAFAASSDQPTPRRSRRIADTGIAATRMILTPALDSRLLGCRFHPFPSFTNGHGQDPAVARRVNSFLIGPLSSHIVLETVPITHRITVTVGALGSLLVKHFAPQQLINCYHEAMLYQDLNSRQGSLLPYCYGVWESRGLSGVLLVLEKIDGATLRDHLKLVMDKERLCDLYFKCWTTLCKFHESGHYHGDIRDTNFIITADGAVVLIDFENARPITETGKKFDGVELRTIFRQKGMGEDELKRMVGMDWPMGTGP